jgi:hypothetical protein
MTNIPTMVDTTLQIQFKNELHESQDTFGCSGRVSPSCSTCELNIAKIHLFRLFFYLSSYVSPNGKLDFSRKNEKEPVMESHV